MRAGSAAFFMVMVWVGVVCFSDAQESGFAIYRQDLRNKIALQKKVVEGDPLDYRSYFELGLVYQALGRHEDEIDAYRESLRLYSRFSVVYENLSVAYDLLKQGENAIRHARRALELYERQRNHVAIRRIQRMLLKYEGKYRQPR